MLTEFFTAKFSTNFHVALRFFRNFIHWEWMAVKRVRPASAFPSRFFRETALTASLRDTLGTPRARVPAQLSSGGSPAAGSDC